MNQSNQTMSFGQKRMSSKQLKKIGKEGEKKFQSQIA
jgi:hypothetical protein